MAARPTWLLAARALPVPIERALDLRYPDEGPDDDEDAREDPQTGHCRDGLRLSRLLVHPADLVCGDERHHDADEKGDQQGNSSAEALVGLTLHLVVRDVVPVGAVDPERDEVQEDD